MKNTAGNSNTDSPKADSFEALGIVPFLCDKLRERSIQKPTEVQSVVIPHFLLGENVLFRSPTGTGKTFAYLLPVLQRLFTENSPGMPQGKVRLLICAPTLELCSQIKGEVDFLLGAWPAETAPRAILLIGSANMERQITTLKKERPAIIVGNPARLLQLLRMGRLRLNEVKTAVLDEGDRLVSDEMREETEALFRFFSKPSAGSLQTASCSATVSDKSRERLLPLLGSKTVFLETKGICRNIEHWAFFSEGRKKISCLRSLLAAAKPKKALVFTTRAGEVGNILSQLQHHHFAAGAVCGDMDKQARKASMDGFRKGNLAILVATDLACRGLDIPGISHVIALDTPSDTELYLHRSGRTGRTGKRGVMATIGNEEEMRRLERIEKKLGIVVYPKELYGGRILAP